MAEKLLLKISDNWVVHQKGSSLVISGGADAQFELALSDKTSIFSSLGNKTYRPDDLSAEDKIIHEQLVAAGISAPVVNFSSPLKVRIYSSEKRNITPNGFILESSKPDFAVLLRQHGTLAQNLLDWQYSEIDIPHILIDTAFRDTISIGPLVFPRETACLACLQGRIEHRWGDESPPPIPRASTQEKIIDGIIEGEIQRYIEQDYTKIGKTIAINLRTYCSVEHALYKIDYCPLCRKVPIDRTQKLN